MIFHGKPTEQVILRWLLVTRKEMLYPGKSVVETRNLRFNALDDIPKNNHQHAKAMKKPSN
jgi:hypothetical protein